VEASSLIAIRRRLSEPPVDVVSNDYAEVQLVCDKLTAHEPATLATMPPLIIIGFTPRVLLKIMPLNAPATMLLVASSIG
jgi:hypothetical protein